LSKPSQKQSSTTNQSTTGTSAFNTSNRSYAPDWITNAVQGVTSNVSNLAGQNPQSFVAGPNALLSQAANGAQNLSGTPWDYDGALDVTAGVAHSKAPQIADLMRSFMDPYQNQVVDATSADLDHSDNIARQQSDLSNPGAFGGSGVALTKSAMEDALSRARATTLGGLRSQGFATALQGATAQAGANQNTQAQRLAAGGQYANIADQFGANQRATVAAQDAAGAPLQAIAQSQAQAPLNLATWGSQTLPDLLRSYFGTDATGATNSTQNMTGTTTGNGSSNPGALSSAGDLAMIASLFMGSDRSLKRDVRQIGEMANGLALYVYRYIWGPARFIGVMADEVAKIRPQAVRERPDGFLEVNYSALA
jgi:hypothetical protein